MNPSDRDGREGFALVITLTLLALLVLTVTAVSTLVRAGADVAAVTGSQTVARQHALLGLEMALEELRRHASDDTRVTGMAGVTGIPAQGGSTMRHWCGVWRNDGSFVAWLTSGAQVAPVAALNTGVTAIELVASGSVGASAAQSEHVIAGKVPIVVPETPAEPGAPATVGAYAFLVGDEGVKISARPPAAQQVLPGLRPLIPSVAATSAPGKLRAAVDTFAGALPKVLSYEQLSLLPTPAAALTPSVLQDSFHHVTLTALMVNGNDLVSGAINLNTTSPTVWRSIFETYNAVPDVTPMSAGTISSKGAAVAGALAATTSGKALNGPFTSVAAFGASSLLAGNLPAGVTPARFMEAIGGLLTVRSDTFRIRAYGEAVNPLDAGKVEAAAWCEAIVQRTPDATVAGAGRSFAITFFRWLGSDDI